MNINIKQLNSQEQNFLQDLKNLTTFELSEDFQIENTVREIIQNVRNNGDSAVLSYTQKFDNLQNINNLSQLQITPTELDQAISKVPQEKLNAIKIAAERIKNFHQKQFEKLGGSWDFTENENILGQRIFPLQKVGLYVPGGKAAYPSSVLMNAIPAKVAGVKELIMVVPTPNGEKNAMVLAAAKIAGVDKIFTIGGAQAVAALAFGTQTIPKVAKIVGPGNAYVAAAKRQVFGVVGIDMIAGPSEILVIADDSANPDWVAIDLFSQAEHDELAQAILISPSENFIKKVQKSVENLIKNQPRKEMDSVFLYVTEQVQVLFHRNR
ncbi:MAG: histidinol dehydrogenase, partial [Rhodocyclaceae bacterium]